jgi:alpha-beta hydrolase superfamily lysophospholipase
MQRKEGHFRGFDGTELFYQTWEQPNSCGTIVITHGLAEHSECYQRLVDGLAPHGWSCLGWDMRGHGKSEGKRGAVKAFDDFSSDLKVLSETLPKLNLPKPYFLLGHSMGGLVNINAILKFGEMGYTAATLSSPLLGIAMEVPPLKDMAARFLKSWIPSLTLNNEIIYEDLTHDEAVYSTYDRDPLRHDKISLALYLGMIDTFNWVLLNAPKFKIPVFMQLAGEDRITSRKAAERFFERLGSPRKDLKIYKDYYHEIFNETGRQQVYTDLNNFLKGFLAKP